jgi:hypothetical protein
MSFAGGQPKPANGGRKKGVRNKRTVAATSKAAHPDALDHLAAVMAAKDDPTITPDLRFRAAIGLAAYQHPKPFPLKETFVGPIDYAAPKTVQQARAAILELGERMARREISVEAHDALINGIRTYLRRPNNGRSSTSSKSSLRSGDSSRARHSGEPPQARIWADDQRLPADRITQAKLRPTRPSREPLSHRAGRPRWGLWGDR